jgi:hypothetical protein
MRYSKSVNKQFYHRFHIFWVTKYCYKRPLRTVLVLGFSRLGRH